MSLKKFRAAAGSRFFGALALALLVGGIGSAAAADTPMLTVSPSVVNLAKGAKLTIGGIGFPKSKELGIRLVMGGVVSDIRHQVKPAPTTNDQGAFHSVWVLDGEQNLLAEGTVALSVVDDDGKVLAQTPVVWLKEAKKAAKKEEKKE